MSLFATISQPGKGSYLAHTMEFRDPKEHLGELRGQPRVVGVGVLLQRLHHLLLGITNVFSLFKAGRIYRKKQTR